MGKIRNRQLDSGRGVNDRKYKAEGNYQHVKPKWEEDRKTRKFVFHPKTEAQQQSLHSFEDNMVTINHGSVATGKTAISCWWLANQYLEGKIKKIYIGRPNTTLANRENGFRSGNILEKCYASLLPQIQYLSDVLGRNVVDMQLEKKDGFIELLDIEYLRGMDFGHNIGIHLDEAQLLRPAEIDCMMTRLSTGSKLILSCDPLQRDQPKDQCGVIYLKHLVDKYNLKDIEDTQFDYSELPLQELEEELQMYNEDIKKLKRAIADKKKESETSKKMKPKRKVGVEKILDAEYEKLKGLNKLT